jgi:hypothetical protein
MQMRPHLPDFLAGAFDASAAHQPHSIDLRVVADLVKHMHRRACVALVLAALVSRSHQVASQTCASHGHIRFCLVVHHAHARSALIIFAGSALHLASNDSYG